MRISATVMVFVCFLSAIQIAPSALAGELIGQGPITISRYVEEGYEKFKRKDGRLYFAVSADGRAYNYSYCEETRCQGGRHQFKIMAISWCEKSFPGAECFIFADKRQIVWDGEVRYESQTAVLPSTGGAPALDSSDQEIIEKFVSLQKSLCPRLMRSDNELVNFITRHNMTIEAFCNCQTEEFFRALPIDALDKALLTALKNDDPAGVQGTLKPFQPLMEAATYTCLSGVSPPEDLFTSCSADSSASSECGKYILDVIKRGESWAKHYKQPSCAPEESTDHARLNAVLGFMFEHPSLRLEAPEALVVKAYQARFCPDGRFTAYSGWPGS